MIRRSLIRCAMGALVLLGQAASASEPASVYNTIPDEIGKLNYRMQNGPPGGKSVFYMKGLVYAYVPGDVECDPAQGACEGFAANNPKRHGVRLMGFEGYNVRWLTRHPLDNTLLYASREIVFYTNPATGEILKEWKNPWTGETVPVIPVMNEYMDSTRATAGFANPSRPMEERSLNYASNADVFPNYNLKKQFAQADNMNLANDGQYTSAELFDFYLPKSSKNELHCADFYLNYLPQRDARRWENILCFGGKTKWLDWAPKGTVSWSRVGPWLPWMGMSEEASNSRHVPGVVVYHVRSETMTQFEDLPEDFRNRMRNWFDGGAMGLQAIGFEAWKRPANYEEYNAVQPRNNGKNDTTWSVFLNKVLQPQGLTWQQWVDSGFPLPRLH